MAVQVFDGVGGVDDAPYLLRLLEERGQIRPIIPPAFYGVAVLAASASSRRLRAARPASSLGAVYMALQASKLACRNSGTCLRRRF